MKTYLFVLLGIDVQHLLAWEQGWSVVTRVPRVSAHRVVRFLRPCRGGKERGGRDTLLAKAHSHPRPHQARGDFRQKQGMPAIAQKAAGRILEKSL